MSRRFASVKSRAKSRAKSRIAGLGWGLASFVMVLSFQNCDGGFKYNAETASLSSAGAGLEKFRLSVFEPSGSTIPEGQSLDGGTEYRLEGAGPDLPVTVVWKLLTNTGNCILKTGPGTAIRYITCDKNGRVQVQSSAYWQDGSVTVLVTDRATTTNVADACGVNLSTRRVFRIPAGTGAAAWNSFMNPMVVFVGQTIRVCNADTVMHQFRSAGTPCVSQPAPMANQGYYDCVVANSTGLAADKTFLGLYDQLNGPSAAFYVKPLNGQQLYADNTKTSNGSSCVTCHGQFSDSEKRGSSFTGLKAAIDGGRGGMGVYVGRITDDELRAIAFSLNQ
jgi:hypothetical protein